MCHANANLFYGLWVTTASLNFAAAAHKATRGPVLAIDLIVARRRAGKLEVEGQGARTTARELPEEVWEMVKHELLGVEVRQAELDTLARFRCWYCREREWEQAYHCQITDDEPRVEHVWSHWGEPSCDFCMDSVLSSCVLYRHSPKQIEEIKALLESYKLELAAISLWTKGGHDCWYDFGSLSAIASPRPATLSAPILHGGWSPEPGPVLSTLFSDFFHLTRTPTRHFRQLVRDFCLDVVDRVDRTVLPLKASDSEQGGQEVEVVTSRAGGKQKEGLEPKRVEPRWMLWNEVDAC